MNLVFNHEPANSKTNATMHPPIPAVPSGRSKAKANVAYDILVDQFARLLLDYARDLARLRRKP